MEEYGLSSRAELDDSLANHPTKSRDLLLLTSRTGPSRFCPRSLLRYRCKQLRVHQSLELLVVRLEVHLQI
jgi:hypothetical protein